MQNTALGRRGRWQLQPHTEAPLETHFRPDWQMKGAEIASIKKSHLPEWVGGDHLQYLVWDGRRKKDERAWEIELAIH